MAIASWKRSALLAVMLLLCGMGAWVSNYLLQVHDGAPAGAGPAGGLIAHLCSSNPDQPSGCEASAKSPWSEIRVPVPGHAIHPPVAFLAIAYFVALGVWYAFVGEAQPLWKPLKWLPIIVAAAGIYSSLFFISLMAMGRASWCGGCVAVHSINLFLVISIVLSRRWARKADLPVPVLNHRQSAAVIGFAVLLIGMSYAWRSRRLSLENQLANLQPYERIVESLQENPKLMMDAYLAEPMQAIGIRPDETDPAAKHQLVVFLDFECPACLITAEFVRGEIKNDFGDSLNVIVRHYPLCTACNPYVTKTIHRDACKAAYAAEAARAVGGRAAFDRMSDALFLDQPYLGGVNDRDLAIEAGIDPDQFLKKLDDPAVRQRVSQDIAEGNALGVTNTPTIFLDGRMVPQICMVPEFWKAVAKPPSSQP